MRFQQNLAGRRAEHNIAGSGYAVAVSSQLPPVIGRMRCPRRAVPTVEATVAIGWHRLCGRGGARRTWCGHAAVKMKAGGRCGGEEGMQEVRRNTFAASRGEARDRRAEWEDTFSRNEEHIEYTGPLGR
jgi:hypothetical protein